MNAIILDMDNTLIKSFKGNDYKRLKIDSDASLRDIKNRSYLLPFDNIKWGIKRPYFDKFSDFLFDNFEIIAIWSAGGYDYVHEVLEKIFGDKKEKLFIYTREDCRVDKKGNLIKPIAYMLENIPGLKHKTDIGNVIIVDDLETTFVKNRDNAVHIPEYDPQPTISSLRQRDVGLLQLMKWIKDHKHTKKDIRNVPKDDMFDYEPKKCRSVGDINNKICEIVQKFEENQ